VASGTVLERFNMPLFHGFGTEFALLLGRFGLPIKVRDFVHRAKLGLGVAMTIEAESHA
jgi:hypothetical protein